MRWLSLQLPDVSIFSSRQVGSDGDALCRLVQLCKATFMSIWHMYLLSVVGLGA